MEKKTFKTKSTLNQGHKSVKASLLMFDLPTLIDKMKHKHTWAKGEYNAMTLMKNPDKHVVLTALYEGTKINSFQSHDSIIFHIIEGKLKFHAKKKSVILDKGQLLTLPENIKYSLTPKEETVFFLTIVNSSLQLAENNMPKC